MYLLASLEPGRFQTQILHEYDTCKMTPLCLCTFCRLCDECSLGGCGAGCFSPHNRHDSMLQYERNVRAELQADDRAASAHSHGWFTCTAVNHSKHEVSDQGKTVMAAVMAMVEEGKVQAAAPEWGSIPCDVRLRPLSLAPSRSVRARPQSC